MAKEKLKSLITAFTPDGNYLAILSPDGTVKVWNTSNGSQFAEWSGTEEISDVSFSCMACSFIGKMRRKERGTCLVALGTNNGDISVVNISVGQMMWKSTAHHPGGVASLSFGSKGGRLHAVGKSGGASEMMSETGELTREFKISKKSIAAVAYLCEDKIVAAIGHNIRILSWDDGKEVLKFSSNLDQLRSISSSDDAQFIVASGVGEKSLHVWKCNFGTRDVSNGLVLPLKHRPLRIECKNSCDGEDGLIVLSVSEAGVVYLWKLKSVSDEVNPTKISIKDDTSEADSLTSGGAKKNRVSIIAARIHALENCGLVKALISFGSVDSPQFSIVDIDRPDQEIIITATDIAMQENGLQVEEGLSNQKEKPRKKRAASDLEIASGTDNGHGDAKDGIHIDYDLDEPTMGDKLANLNLVEVAAKSQEKIESSPCTQPPSADSIHVLLKQALHADDRALLIDCLYRQDEKVVANSVSLLNPSDVLKLLQSLVSIIQSRGAVLVCALSWLRSLLLQHASGIMSQESSLLALNTLYQLIESRVSTFNQTLQLSSSLDLLYAGTVDDGIDENEIITPAFYEDKDESDEDVSADAMETESDESGQEPEILSDISDFEGME
ncbi:hypothetical protein ACH5RR_024582 [Cinchona calisaya]|uniref:Small-subunit processome Utp12 domain-containing protein n=1 Tax=Cinchona calisaya TaxID=153742 RepID=A0ABD2YX40_9GENT